jgi:hypothetical protein
VYYVGVINDKFPSNYDEMRVGFAREFVPKGTAPDPFAFARSNLALVEGFHYPTRSYPADSWETWESGLYAAVAFDVANALESVDGGQAEQWYRRAIQLGPNTPGPYKNLAILMQARGESGREIADLLEQYLALAPNDVDAATIREFIATERAAQP